MIQRRTILGLLATLPVLGPVLSPMLWLAGPALAAAPEVYSQAGLAISGTDPVAYFRDGAAVRGHLDFALMWHGATWAFATAENMEAFEMNPDAYAPQFGGYCAFALAQGTLASTVPDAWTIYQGRLYLNYSLSVRDQWTADIPGNLARAAERWPGILQS